MEFLSRLAKHQSSIVVPLLRKEENVQYSVDIFCMDTLLVLVEVIIIIIITWVRKFLITNAMTFPQFWHFRHFWYNNTSGQRRLSSALTHTEGSEQ
jgi:hypothetical protein